MIGESPDRWEALELTEDLVARYRLDPWADAFSMMTAGYRDQLDPADAASAEAPFNLVTVAIMAEAKARVFADRAPAGQRHVHVGGEVRAHTQAFMMLMARIYAANGYVVHLRDTPRTTPIWYSSFGTFYDELLAGDCFTASHSSFNKGGWKALDAYGQQLTLEEDAIVAAVKAIVRERATIRLAPLAEGVRRDFDVDDGYEAVLRGILGPSVLATLTTLERDGFVCHASPLGGSMGATTRRLFERLGVPVGPVVRYFYEEEDSRFHRVGEVNGENHGADACKPEIYRNDKVGARRRLLDEGAHVVFLWDPDGDRFNAATTAPAALAPVLEELGVEVETVPGHDRCVTYFSPNHLYMLLVDYRMRVLARTGELGKYDWFVGTSYPTAKAIGELARHRGLPVMRVPVGFRYIGALCRELEGGLGAPATVRGFLGEETAIGPQPRALMLCEESGGATLGGSEPFVSRHGNRKMLALREKDGMQVALLTLALVAELRAAGSSLGEQYRTIVEEAGVESRYFRRYDVKLYDEMLTGAALREAKKQGGVVRDATVAFFAGLVEAFAAGVPTTELDRRLAGCAPAGVTLPPLQSAANIRDGSLFELDGLRIIVRASGTDALLRYYVDSRERGGLLQVERFAKGFVAPGA